MLKLSNVPDMTIGGRSGDISLGSWRALVGTPAHHFGTVPWGRFTKLSPDPEVEYGERDVLLDDKEAIEREKDTSQQGLLSASRPCGSHHTNS